MLLTDDTGYPKVYFFSEDAAYDSDYQQYPESYGYLVLHAKAHPLTDWSDGARRSIAFNREFQLIQGGWEAHPIQLSPETLARLQAEFRLTSIKRSEHATD